MKRIHVKESQIVKDIDGFMQIMGYQVVCCVAGPVRSRNNQEVPTASNPAGFPDRCYVRPCDFLDRRKPARVIFVEIKKPGEKPTKLQQAWLSRLDSDGFAATWFDDFRGDYGGNRPFMKWWEE